MRDIAYLCERFIKTQLTIQVTTQGQEIPKDELTLSSPVVPNGYTTKCSKPYWSNPPFLFFLTFGHSGAQDGTTGLERVKHSLAVTVAYRVVHWGLVSCFTLWQQRVE